MLERVRPERVYVVLDTPDGPVVPLPWIGTSWLERGRDYRRRRGLTRAGAVAATLAAVALTGLAARVGLDHSSPAGRAVFGAFLLLLALYGYYLGRLWLRHVPARETNDGGRGGYFAGFLVLLAPMGIGLAAAVLPALFSEQFPGEERAREVTRRLREAYAPR